MAELDIENLTLRLAEALAEIFPPREKMHGWSCEYPDRWPEKCNCALVTAADLVDLMMAPR